MPLFIPRNFLGAIVNRNNVNQTGATGGANNKIQFDNAVSNVQGWFDVTTNFRFQPTLPGVFAFALGAGAQGIVGDNPEAVGFLNGSLAKAGTYLGGVGAAASVVSEATGVVRLNGSTDYFEGYCYLPTGVTVINGGVTQTTLAIWWIGY